MFTQRLSMDCTKEQYEKFLKKELLKMRYNDHYTTFWTEETVIVNNSNGQMGDLGAFIGIRKEKHNRTYLGSFNAPLFLALAAMTDKAEGNYGEYIIGLYTGRFYRMNEKDKILPKHRMIRKATKEEIMVKFGNITFETTRDTKEALGVTEAEISSINLLKSKGYKILKPKIWEEV